MQCSDVRWEMQKAKLEMAGRRDDVATGEDRTPAQPRMRRGAQLNSSRHFDCDESAAISGSDKSIPPSPFLPLPYSLTRSLRAEFVSHTSRRQNSWGIPNNADDDGAADEMFLLPIITHGEAKEKRESGRDGRAGESTMMR